MKSYGANIRCTVCGAEPWPSDPAVRETFSLLRLGPNGRPADSPAEGEWRCEEHPISRQDLPAKRASQAAPSMALTDFENILEAEVACLEEEVRGDDRGDAAEALAAFKREVERGLSELRKAIAPPEPPAPNATSKPRGNRLRPIKAIERMHEGQTSLIEDETAP